MRALVLGGSGHVGNAVVRELLSRGWAVTAARRGRTSAANLAGLAGLPVAEALGDASDARTLDRWVAGHDLVVDAAAPYPLTLAERGAIEVSARRAAALVEATVRHRARLVHIGSFVTRVARPCDLGIHPYFAAKRIGELVFAEAARGGAHIAIVHPTTCMGPWDSRPAAMSFVPRVLAGQLPAVPAHLINVVDVRDVARGAVGAAEVPGADPLVVAGHDIAIGELCALLGELAGVRVATRVIPAAAARATAWAVELATLGAAIPPLLLPTLLALEQTALPVSAAQRALGASPRPLTVTLRDAIAWYRDNGSPPDAPSRPAVI
jgi:nucleoside-diphosphate-sugar epimerase